MNPIYRAIRKISPMAIPKLLEKHVLEDSPKVVERFLCSCFQSSFDEMAFDTFFSAIQSDLECPSVYMDRLKVFSNSREAIYATIISDIIVELMHKPERIPSLQEKIAGQYQFFSKDVPDILQSTMNNCMVPKWHR